MEIIVIGCGVSGLTTGLTLLDAGYTVRLLTRELPEQTVSSVAAAIWYPFQAYPVDKVVRWGQISHQVFQTLAQDPTTGVRQVTLWEFLTEPTPAPWWQEAVPNFSRLAAADLPPGYADGFALDVPLIETPLYMVYLREQFQAKGGTIEVAEVKTLKDVARPQTLIINCTGLGARELADDQQLYPIRGQIMRVQHHGSIPTILDEHSPTGLTYIIPRSDGIVLGGTIQTHDWRTDPDPADQEGIWQRATQLVPALTNAQILAHRVGLRPGRPTVRLELEWLDGPCPIIHNYGHGGAGFTLSWGCAQDVLALAQTVL